MAHDQTLHFGLVLLEQGWTENVRIHHRQGLCTAIETGIDAAPGDDRNDIAIPGMPNLHSHAFQRGMAGMAERRGPANDSFWTWRELMYRFVNRISPEDLTDIASMAYVEMLETGFTRVGEFHYLHHDRDGRAFEQRAVMSAAIVEAARSTGIALTHLPVFYAHSGFGGAAPGEEQRRFIHDIDGFARLLEGARVAARDLPDAIVGIAPHSLRAVTLEELQDLVTLAQGGPIHIHVAEQLREVEDCVTCYGARPVELLLERVPVDDRWCLVHATHMTDAEAADMARRGAVAGLCPITEANLGDGLFNLVSFRQNGGVFGIGSDSNVLIDASEELRLLEYGQRLFTRQRNVVSDVEGDNTGRILFDKARAGGGAALGVPSVIAEGHALDAVSLKSSHPALTGKTGNDLLSSWIFAGGRTAIDCVWRRGEKVVSSGRHQARDRVERRFRNVMQTLL